MVERVPWWLIGLIVFVLAEVIVGLFVYALCQMAGRADEASEAYLAEMRQRERPRRVPSRLRSSCSSRRR